MSAPDDPIDFLLDSARAAAALRRTSPLSPQVPIKNRAAELAALQARLPPPAWPTNSLFDRAVRSLQQRSPDVLLDNQKVPIDTSVTLGAGASKTAHPVRGDDTKIALVTRVSVSVVTEAAVQIILHKVLTDFVGSLDASRRKHYALIPEVFSVSRVNGKCVIVMQRIGKSLDKTLLENKSDQTFCICLYQVARTIQWLRKKCNFIHGDLKMDNVALTEFPSECPTVQSYIIDFGFASMDLEEPRVRVAPRPKYMDTTTRTLGPPGHNDLLFFLITSYVGWRDMISSYNAPKIRSVLQGYALYLVNTLYVQLRAKTSTDQYAIYNANSAGVLDDSVGVEIARIILNEYKSNACIASMLADNVEDQSQLSTKEAMYRARANDCAEKLEQLQTANKNPRKLLQRTRAALLAADVSASDLERAIQELRAVSLVLIDRRKKMIAPPPTTARIPWRPN